jgi:HAD superfamily hydrolase (TIGR01509 family)
MSTRWFSFSIEPRIAVFLHVRECSAYLFAHRSGENLVRKVEAILWDLDGTIVDSEPLWIEAETEMLEEHNLELTDAVREQLVGAGLWVCAKIFQGIGVPLTADEIVDRWSRRVIELFDIREPNWRPGARALLSESVHSGLTNVLVTMSTSPIAQHVISNLPANTFDAVVTGDQVEKPKPFPDPYVIGAQSVQCEIGSCVALEDSANGLRAAASSGAVAIGIEHQVPLKEEAAHVLLNSLSGVDLADLQSWFTEFAGTPPQTGGHLDLRDQMRSVSEMERDA